MFNNVALDVVIGLVFVFLLYSLFASVLAEMIATGIGLRSRNLKEAVDRMLNDEPQAKSGIQDSLKRLWDSFKLMKNPRNPRIVNFYNHPEIRYLGSTGIFRNPSNFKAVSFSKTIILLLNEIGYKKSMGGDTATPDPDKGDIRWIPVTPPTRERIELALEGIISDHKTLTGDTKAAIVLDEESAKYVLSLWHESYGDLQKFRLHLETWFDRTMEQALEWYKRKIQTILLFLGLMLAWSFNADTFTIIHKLANDKDAREKMVTLAAAYSEKANQAAPGISAAKTDSILAVQKHLQQDINNANSLLGSGGWPADSVKVIRDAATGVSFQPQVDPEVVHDMRGSFIQRGDHYIHFRSLGDKWEYFVRLLTLHFFGFLITAIAISLGAPFWFDLLNKLMKFRTAVKQPIHTPNYSGGLHSDDYVSPLNRVG
ncbi:hypothetical protein V9K67_06600 [Paraflavisolibacter sp. H34]|uniref:hypothetical protein n=1 Tax=Huijunlia imazamoxiresistens TaxID=3127457 RepID=UPI00301A1101